MNTSINIRVYAPVMLAMIVSCRACFSSLPAHVDDPTWEQVRESLRDWVVQLPERGTPTRLETTEGLRGNHRRVVIAFPGTSQRDAFLQEFERLMCKAPQGRDLATSPDETCSSKILSKGDGSDWPWLVEVRPRGAESSAEVEIEAWQPYH